MAYVNLSSSHESAFRKNSVGFEYDFASQLISGLLFSKEDKLAYDFAQATHSY